MTNNFPLLLSKAHSRSKCAGQDVIAGALLKSFLKQSQRGSQPLTIISVYGKSFLNRQIVSYAPKETEFVRIRHELHTYLSKPRFDVILFTAPDRKHKESELYENLSYCRMLLKPGGSIWLLLETNHRYGFLQRLLWKKSREAAWLTRTGFTQLHRKKIGPETVFLCGSRTKRPF